MSANAPATRRCCKSAAKRRVYAESILKVCEFYLESPLTCMSGVTGSDLKKRVQRIMKEPFWSGSERPEEAPPGSGRASDASRCPLSQAC